MQNGLVILALIVVAAAAASIYIWKARGRHLRRQRRTERRLDYHVKSAAFEKAVRRR